MNSLDKQYTDLLQTILEHGVDKKDRTGTGTKSIFGYTIRHNMKDGFPLLTTKKMPFKTIVTELLWFLQGNTNIKYLVDNNCHIWDGDAFKNYVNTYKGNFPMGMEEFIETIKTNDEFAERWGNLGPIYGKQWRKWKGKLVDKSIEFDAHTAWVPEQIDQIQNLINDLKTNPDSRRMMVNAWNVGELDQMVLPPCHYGFQVYTREIGIKDELNLIGKIVNYKGSEYKIKRIPPVGLPFIVIDTEDGDLTIREEWLDFAIVMDKNTPTRAISLMWNQRSVDTFLGLPFNIASYGLLLEILAKEVNMVPDELIGNLGDVHLYSNHIEQAKEQIGRQGLQLPILKFTTWANMVIKDGRNLDWIMRETDTIDDWFQLENYQSHPAIKAPLSN
jgi:thymidylate synthase